MGKHLTLNDRAGNISKINIVIDKDGVDAVWTNDEEEIPNNFPLLYKRPINKNNTHIKFFNKY